MFVRDLFLVLIFFSVTIVNAKCDRVSRPNIVLIMGDDMGWNDVSYHGSDQILTPNIDALAYSGIVLHQYRTHGICTPSRAAMLSGMFAHKLGMQGYPLTNAEDRALPVDVKILPEYLKELGYATHLVGKWHLGHSRFKYLPCNRGFDTHFGHRGGYIDYYEYTSEETWTSGDVSGLDLFRNVTAAWDVEGYITDVYTSEAKKLIKSHDATKPLFLQVSHNAPHSGNAAALLQAPPDVVRSMRHVESPKRRIYAAMIKKLDDGIGELIEALYDKGILSNTIVIFLSDNGGMTSGSFLNWASNWPMRGIKMSPFEGGIRVVASIWSANLNNSNHIWKGNMHAVDWLPTLLKAVGGDVPHNIDGIDLWDSILQNTTSAREEVFEIDDWTGYSAMISGKYKLITGEVNVNYSGFFGEDLRGIIGESVSYSDAVEETVTYKVLNKMGISVSIDNRNNMKIECAQKEFNKCYPGKDRRCLYNIEEDPCEKEDLLESLYDIGEEMSRRIDEEWRLRRPRQQPLIRDTRGTPSLHNNTWISWLEGVH